MTDFFAVMQEPRRPWIDPELLTQKFLALSSELHPDRFHQASPAERASAQARYVELNSAHRCLKEPKDRVLHLLELELGTKPAQIQNVPPDLMDLSLGIADACRTADHFLEQRGRTTSALLQVELFQRGQEHIDTLTKLLNGIKERQEAQIADLKAVDADWTSDRARRPAALHRLEGIHRWLSYLARWTSQIQDRIVRLSF
jgi:DnaJ-domain-containing protein 1